MKAVISESQYNRLIDSFITFLIEPHEEITDSGYSDSTFWIKNGEIISEKIEEEDIFLFSDSIWYEISEQFELDYDETQSVIKTWLEQHYGLGELTPYEIEEEDVEIWNNIIISNDNL